MPEIEFIGTAVSNVSIDVRSSFAYRVHPETWIGQSDGFDEYSYYAYSQVLMKSVDTGVHSCSPGN
jgi:hypothetical protein